MIRNILSRRRRSTSRPSRESGQGLVEFTLGITFMLILLAGAIDLGRAYFTYIALLDASQEGASYASFEPADVNGIRSHVRASSTGMVDLSSLTDSEIEVIWGAQVCAGHGITVRVHYTFDFIAPFIGGLTLPLTAEVTDTILQPPC